ncbi:MAG TPA: alpha/beta family hydrolase [Chloroflexia bacterium]|nr:alpha/beta family hydrolase [Chloroflexia bacterium]
METNNVTFPSADGQAELEAVWHLPARRATNGAVIVLHGTSYNKDSEPSTSLCEGAARLGLTALRFDFRYVHNGEREKFNPVTHGLSDLLGAYNFLQSFGKEIKPRRLYLIGKSLGGLVALGMATNPEYAAQVNGVGVLGLVMHNTDGSQWFLPEGLPELKAPLFVAQGSRDPYGSPEELRRFLEKLEVPASAKIIEGGGHSYEYLPSGGKALAPEQAELQSKTNMAQAVNLTLDWLEKLDATRPDLRI